MHFFHSSPTELPLIFNHTQYRTDSSTIFCPQNQSIHTLYFDIKRPSTDLGSPKIVKKVGRVNQISSSSVYLSRWSFLPKPSFLFFLFPCLDSCYQFWVVFLSPLSLIPLWPEAPIFSPSSQIPEICSIYFKDNEETSSFLKGEMIGDNKRLFMGMEAYVCMVFHRRTIFYRAFIS